MSTLQGLHEVDAVAVESGGSHPIRPKPIHNPRGRDWESVPPPRHPDVATGAVLASTRHLLVSYGPVTAVRNVSTSGSAGEIVPLTVRTGYGKS